MYVFTEKTITMRGVSRITTEERGAVDAAAFEAVISSVDPINMTISSYAVDPEVYKANITQCRQDEDTFRDYVQGIQDELIAATAQLPEE